MLSDDEFFDYNMGSVGGPTTGIWGQIGAENYKARQQATASYPNTPSASGAVKAVPVIDTRTPAEIQKDRESSLAIWSMLITSGLVGWWGLSTWETAWYLPVGTAVAVGMATAWFLAGPARCVLRVAVHMLVFILRACGTIALAGLLGLIVCLYVAPSLVMFMGTACGIGTIGYIVCRFLLSLR